MEINWIIIIVVLLIAIGLVAYLVRQNLKDKKKVTKFFNAEFPEVNEDEELNNER